MNCRDLFPRLWSLLLAAGLLSSCALYGPELAAVSPDDGRLFNPDENLFANSVGAGGEETEGEGAEAQAQEAPNKGEAEAQPASNQARASSGGLGGFFRGLFSSDGGEEEGEEVDEGEAQVEPQPEQDAGLVEENSAQQEASEVAEEEKEGGFFSGIGNFFGGLFGGKDEAEEEAQELVATESLENEATQASAAQNARSRAGSSRRRSSTTRQRRQASSQTSVASSTADSGLGELPPLGENGLLTRARNPEAANEVLQNIIQKRRENQQANSASADLPLPPIAEPERAAPPQPEQREEPSTEGAPREPIITLPPAGNPSAPSGSGVATPENPLGPLSLP